MRSFARCGIAPAQSLTLRRRNSQVRHSGPVHRTPDTAGGLGILNELRHVGECFWVALRHRDRDAGLLKSSIDDVRAGEFRDEAMTGARLLTALASFDTLVPAYAASIHKSQGSEYPAVVIPVMTQHYAMLQRNLLYTGVTRGKRLVVFVGQKKSPCATSRAGRVDRSWRNG